MLANIKNASALLALPGLFVSLFALGGTGCSSSSSPGPASDASTGPDAAEAGPASPLGVPVASCAGCVDVCGGVLASATTGFTFCTQDCTTNADCPTGTGCAADVLTSELPDGSQLPSECLKTCTTDADCSGGFICRSDIATTGSYCWSPFPPPADGGPGAGEAGPDAEVADTGTPDAGAADASDAGSTGDASDGAVPADAASE
jgi:hypothetical protein